MREFTVAEIAELLDVNEETVRRWRIRGRNGVQLAVPSAGDRPGRARAGVIPCKRRWRKTGHRRRRPHRLCRKRAPRRQRARRRSAPVWALRSG